MRPAVCMGYRPAGVAKFAGCVQRLYELVEQVRRTKRPIADLPTGWDRSDGACPQADDVQWQICHAFVVLDREEFMPGWLAVSIRQGMATIG